MGGLFDDREEEEPGQNQGGQTFMDLINQIQQQMSSQQDQEDRRPTNENFIRGLPELPIEEKHCKKDEKGNLEKPTCSVCITDLELGTKSLFLPCGHIFHGECIKPWLKDNNTCPVCRKELPT